ncbi:nucleotidyltransferase substrate binding protein [Planctomycetota bacterium]
MLELTSLQKAVASLRDALDWYHREDSVVPREILRDSVIQRFEYTYELAWKMTKRWLEINLGGGYVDGVSRKELFRLAAENHLLQDPGTWFTYHEARNRTSHVYEEAAAEAVFKVIGDFHRDTSLLLAELEKRND